MSNVHPLQARELAVYNGIIERARKRAGRTRKMYLELAETYAHACCAQRAALAAVDDAERERR